MRVIEYRSPDRTSLIAALEDWRFVEASAQGGVTDGQTWTPPVRTFWSMLERASEYALAPPGRASNALSGRCIWTSTLRRDWMR